MIIDVHCMNCKEHILQADTDTLKSPLVGEMFPVKRDMEWSIFSPADTGNDLVCPLCAWAFHQNGLIRVIHSGDIYEGTPEQIINNFHRFGVIPETGEVEGVQVSMTETVEELMSIASPDVPQGTFVPEPKITDTDVKEAVDNILEKLQAEVETPEDPDPMITDKRLQELMDEVEGEPETEKTPIPEPIIESKPQKTIMEKLADKQTRLKAKIRGKKGKKGKSVLAKMGLE